MPEGDTVWRTAHRLDQALAGRPLLLADLRWPSLATSDLTGMVTTEVVSRGKHILHRLDSDLTLHSHLRMDGQWRIWAAGAASTAQLRRSSVRAVLGADAWVAVGDRLGMLDLVRRAEEATLVGHLGPDLLGPDWDIQNALGNLRARPDTSIGWALLDQTNLAGIGTMYAAETLFLQRRHPWQPVGQVADSELSDIVERARRLLDCGRIAGVQSTTGSTRKGEDKYVHARSGLPCRRCGAAVRVAPIGPALAPSPTDRSMFYCPSCQGGRGPTDDGRPQRPLGAARRRT